MSHYNVSIGEPECSQDTPFPNTTPVGKRRVTLDARPGPAKKPKPQKMNQCQTLFSTIVTSRRLEDEFDPTFEGADKHLRNVENILKTKDAYIQETKEEQDELLLLIQRLDEKSSAAKQSRDLICAEFSGAGPANFGQPSRSADFDMPDYDEHHDGLAIRQYLQAHNERAETIGNASESHETLKQQAADFKGKLEQLRTDLSTQVKQVHEHLRLEYEGRLSQQRRELDERAQNRKANFNKELEDKQKVIDEMTAHSSRSHQIEIENAVQVGKATADKEMEELRLHLHETKQRFREARQAEKSSKEELNDQQWRHDEELSTHQRAYDKLQAKWERDRKSHEKVKHELQENLDETNEFYGDSLIKLYAKKGDLRDRLGRLKSSFEGTVTVATMQMMQLDVARREKTLLVDCLANAKSNVDGLKSQVSECTATLSARQTRVEQLESLLRKNDRQLDTKEVLIQDFTLQVSDLQEQSSRGSEEIKKLTASNHDLTQKVGRRDRRLKSDAATLLQHKNEITRLHSAKAELEEQVKRLKYQRAEGARELAVQRPIATQQAQRIHELENQSSELKATVARLDSDRGRKESKLSANASVIKSREQQIQKLERAIREVREEKKNTCTAMRSLEEDHLDLKLDLSTRDSELTSQIARVARRDATIRDLEATITSLSQAQTVSKRDNSSLETEISSLRSELVTKNKGLATEASAAILKDARIKELEAINTSLSQSQTAAESNMDILGTRVSKLTLEVQAKTEELGSQKAAAALKDERIQGLEATNAVLLRSQEDAREKNAYLHSDLETANGRTANLEATVKDCGAELRVANEAAERNRCRLEEVEKDVLRAQEEANNEKICIQNRLAAADTEVDNLEAQLTTRDSELRKSNEEIERACRRLAEMEKDLSAEKSANETAGVEIKTANDRIHVLSTDLDHIRERLEKEGFQNDSLVLRVGKLEEEQSKSSEEKKTSEREKMALGERVSQHEDTIRHLESDAALRLTLLDQFRSDRTLFNEERTCLLDQLMAESVRSRYAAGELPNIISGPIGEGRDVRMFQGMQVGEVVLVRVQRFLRDHKAFIIVEKSDHTKIVWHGSLEKCRVSVVEWQWRLCLEKGSNEVVIEVNTGDADPQGLGEWLKGSDRGLAS